MRDIADRRDEFECEPDDVDEDRDFEEMVSVNEVAACEVRDKHKEAQYICEDGCKAVLTSAVRVIALYGDVVESKRKNAKLVSRVNDLEGEQEGVPSVKRLACVTLKVS